MSHSRGEKLGLSEQEVALYDALSHHESAREVLGDQNLYIIAREVAKSIKANVSIDWTIKESVRAKLRTAVKRVLRRFGYPPDQQEAATDLVLQQAELLCAEIAVVQTRASSRSSQVGIGHHPSTKNNGRFGRGQRRT
jgi:type I restriction enzyme R subunit